MQLTPSYAARRSFQVVRQSTLHLFFFSVFGQEFLTTWQYTPITTLGSGHALATMIFLAYR